MKTVVVIPSRYESTRFPGKPLALLCGKPMIWHVYDRARKAGCASEVIVATDDQRILDTVHSFGGRGVMTSRDLPSGTERVRSVASGKNWDVVINLQGDEPLIDPSIIDLLAGLFLSDDSLQIATAAVRNTRVEDFLNPHVVKVVIGKGGEALYFSRSPVPFCPESEFRFFHRHIGIYAFRGDVLEELGTLGESSLEDTESLEQLRWMDYGYDIKVVESDYEPVGVDLPEDLEMAEKMMLRQGGVRET